MPRQKTAPPVASYDPRMIDYLLKAGLQEVTLEAAPGTLDHVKGTQTVIRLRRLIRQMVAENHPLAAQVASIQISNWDPKTGTIKLFHRDRMLDFMVVRGPDGAVVPQEELRAAVVAAPGFDPMAGDKWFEGFLKRNSETGESVE